MKKVIIVNQKKDVLFTDAQMTIHFSERLVGLIGKKNIEREFALYINPCNSIHMFFMKFPIDVIFLDASGRVIYLIENLKPWKISKVIKKSKSVIEMPSGSIKEKSIQIHDEINII